LSATDATFSSGFVCLDADSQPVSYSNVRVAALQNAITVDAINPATVVFSTGEGLNPAPQTLNITANGANATWGATSNVSWLTLAVSNNLIPGQLTVTANVSALAQG